MLGFDWNLFNLIVIMKKGINLNDSNLRKDKDISQEVHKVEKELTSGNGNELLKTSQVSHTPEEEVKMLVRFPFRKRWSTSRSNSMDNSSQSSVSSSNSSQNNDDMTGKESSCSSSSISNSKQSVPKKRKLSSQTSNISLDSNCSDTTTSSDNSNGLNFNIESPFTADTQELVEDYSAKRSRMSLDSGISSNSENALTNNMSKCKTDIAATTKELFGVMNERHTVDLVQQSQSILDCSLQNWYSVGDFKSQSTNVLGNELKQTKVTDFLQVVSDNQNEDGSPMSRDRCIYVTFKQLCNVIGESKKWPSTIRRLFWTSDLDKTNRFKVAVFAAINGVSNNLMLKWAKLMKLCTNDKIYEQFQWLLQQFHHDSKRFRYVYQFHVKNHQYQFLDGRVKFKMDPAVVHSW